MGWSTDALIEVSFNRQTFNSKWDVENYIEDKEREIETAKKTIRQLAFMTEPKKFCEEDADPAWWIQNQIDDAIETIEDNSYLIGIARRVLDGWNYSHHENGMAYEFNGQFLEQQRVWGDFVKTCDKDGKSSDHNYDQQENEHPQL